MKYYRYIFLIGAFIVMQPVMFCLAPVSQNHELWNSGNPVPEEYQLSLDAPVDLWDEAIPLGNGLTGGLLWGADNEIRLSLDRGDLWDLRTHPVFSTPGFNYETIRRLALAGQADSLNKQYARANDYPTKLPGCRLVLTLPAEVKAQSFHLDMKRGVGSVDLGDNHIECFFSAEEPVALMKIPGSYPDFTLVANQAVVKLLDYEPARIDRDNNSVWLVQDATLDFQYVCCVQARKLKDYTATTDQPLRLKNPFEQHDFESNVVLERRSNDELWCQLKKGQTLQLRINVAED